eukprot:COSAG01_NODE_1053_length_11913_cov_4.198307_6_plen_79_part_00
MSRLTRTAPFLSVAFKTAALAREEQEQALEAAEQALAAAEREDMAAAVSRSCACIGSPCLRRCVHGASIGGRRGGGGA